MFKWFIFSIISIVTLTLFMQNKVNDIGGAASSGSVSSGVVASEQGSVAIVHSGAKNKAVAPGLRLDVRDKREAVPESGSTQEEPPVKNQILLQ